AKNALELYAILVDETYGELTSRIFTVLLRRGRQQIPLIAKHTRLSPRQLRHGLVVLIQQNLIFYSTDADTGVTHYEANHSAAYALLRSGKIMETVEDRFGAVAKDVVQNLLLLGHTKIADLEGAYEAQQKNLKENVDSQDDSQIIGMTERTNKAQLRNLDKICSVGQLHSIMLRLLQAGVVEEVAEHMFCSPTDTYNKIEREVLQLYYGGDTKGSKQKEELKIRVKTRLQSLRSDAKSWRSKGKKRQYENSNLVGLNNIAKPTPLSNDIEINSDHHYEDLGLQLNPQMIVRINYDKCIVFLRSHKLTVSAKERIGETTSIIYREALKLIEDRIARCQLDPNIDLPVDQADILRFTTIELTATLKSSIDTKSGIAKLDADGFAGLISDEDSDSEDEQTININGKRIYNHIPKDQAEQRPAIKGQLRSPIFGKRTTINASDSRENRAQQIKNHLSLLAADEFKFLRKCGNGGMGEWTIDFEEVVDRLREAEIDSATLENFGNSGQRLARLLRKYGKLDEKQLPNIALLKQKDVRTKLAEMQMAGVVDIQEVPRDANRTIHRTIFLWYFDKQRVSEMLLDNVFRMMTRVFQRLENERKKAREVLDLTQRSDVRNQKPAEYLDKDQLYQLNDYQTKEEKLLIQLSRLDELVGIFHDY
ncbi:BgTH12-07983, partial [Blumeria graminis f. sp. triticale]